jgi:hypothetical protein
MTAIDLTRISMGVVILAGLRFYRPIAYVVAAMMVIAGLTGT